MTAEFWSEEDTNSGLFIRCAAATNPGSLGGCYEINISDPHATTPTGGIVGVFSPLPRRIKSAGKWSRFDVVADGPHLVVKVNGETVTDVRDEKLREGAIGLQAGGPTGSGPVKFRNIRIRSIRKLQAETPDAGRMESYSSENSIGGTIMRRYSLLFAILIVAVACEDGPTTPSGPAPSFFVTSQRSVTGNLGGLSGADATCQKLATAAGHAGRTWQCLSERGTEPGGWAINPRTPEIGLGRGLGTTSTFN